MLSHLCGPPHRRQRRHTEKRRPSPHKAAICPFLSRCSDSHLQSDRPCQRKHGTGGKSHHWLLLQGRVQGLLHSSHLPYTTPLSVSWGPAKSLGFWPYTPCMHLRLSPNLMGEFSNPLVMSLTGIEEGDGGMYAKALLSRCAVAGNTENPHGIGNGVWGHCLYKSGLWLSRAVTMM